MDYFKLGNICYQNKDYKRAIEYYEEALKIDPKRKDIYNNLVLAYYHNKDFNKALDYYKKIQEDRDIEIKSKQ